MRNDDGRMERNLESWNDKVMDERRNKRPTDRPPTSSLQAGYEEKEVQSDYALVNFFFFWGDSLSTPLLDRYV